MIHYVKVNSDGLVVRQGCAPFGSLDALPEADASYKQIAAPLQHGRTYYWHHGLQMAPMAPSRYHTFDVASREWVLDTDAAWTVVRAKRDTLLASCDWVTLRAQEQGEPVPALWVAYRKALRDITLQADPTAITWPVAPE